MPVTMDNIEWKYRLDSSLGELTVPELPIGWTVAENVLKRQDKYDGIFNNYSLSKLGFYGEAGAYLSTLHESEGITLFCSVTILHFNFLNQNYDTVYYGILNGKTYREVTKGGQVIEMNIGESSLNEKLIARDGNTVGYDDDYSANGTLLTAPYQKYYDCIVNGMEIITANTGEFEFGTLYVGSNKAVASMSVVTKGNNENVLNPNWTGVEEFANIVEFGNGAWLYETFGRSSVVNFKMDIIGMTSISDDGSIFAIVIGKKLENPIIDNAEEDPDPTIYLESFEYIFKKHADYSYYSIDPETGQTTSRADLSIDETFTVPEDHAVMLLKWNYQYELNPDNPSLGYSTSINIQEDKERSMSIDCSEIPTQKTIKSIKTFDLMQRVVESITDQVDVFESPLLTDEQSPEFDFKKVLNFNGYMARGYDTDESRYNTTLLELMTSFGVLFNGGFGTDNGKVIFDKIDRFYGDDIVLVIDSVAKESWQRYTEPKFYTGEVQVGYTKTAYEENSGLEEYNNKVTYTFPIWNVDTKMTLLPSLRGDGYGITFAIDRPKVDTETADTQYDLSNFFMDCRYLVEFGQPVSSGKYVQKGRSGFEVVNNVDQISDPINLRFTPARLMARNSKKLTVGLEKFYTDNIKFTSSDVPTDLQTYASYDVAMISENAPVQVMSLQTARFSGFVVKFEWSLTIEEFYALQQNKYGKIQVLDPIKLVYRNYWIYEIKHTSKDNVAEFYLIETNDVESPETTYVKADHNLDYVVTDNNELISVEDE